MSVDYKSALIYGFDCDPNRFSCEEREFLEELGWDIIRDDYDDKFLYIGKVVSSTGCFEETRVDCIREITGAMTNCNELTDETPDELFAKFPCDASMYHLCYAT